MKNKEKTNERDNNIPFKKEQTPVEWLVGFLKSVNQLNNTLSTRKAIEKALKMERKR